MWDSKRGEGITWKYILGLLAVAITIVVLILYLTDMGSVLTDLFSRLLNLN